MSTGGQHCVQGVLAYVITAQTFPYGCTTFKIAPVLILPLHEAFHKYRLYLVAWKHEIPVPRKCVFVSKPAM